MVIWDLDDTFWKGTLSEGGVSRIEQNVDLVKNLTDRGIINSVCSKNHFEPTRQKLIEFGVWDHFVFPKISFSPKGNMIQEIITSSQLRPASILFVDDNPVNLNEALHYNPGLQVSSPDVLPDLLEDPRFKGKADPDHVRLKRYKVLEEKLSKQQDSEGDNIDFLIQSEIKISFHYDVLENFDRIHELVNRTNQLNFTKNRWPEDRSEAEKSYQAEMAESFLSQSGYIKVSDKYGNYGICGFYLVNTNVAKHFLFSCLSMNMGVEQFVWKTLRRPHVSISGEVISDIASRVDWISVTADADIFQAERNLKLPSTGQVPTICIRGACDLAMVAHYLHDQGELLDEYPYPFRGWGIFPTARIVAAGLEASPSQVAFLSKLPGMPNNRFKSSIIDRDADVYMLSFSQEISPYLYRSKSTGLILPLMLELVGNKDMASISYDELVMLGGESSVSESEWRFLRSELEHVGSFDSELFKNDLAKIFAVLRDKIVIVAMLNTKFGSNKWLLERFGEINEIVRSAVAERNGMIGRPIELIEFDEILRSEEDLTDERGGAHFTRDVYRRVSDQIKTILTKSTPTDDRESRRPMAHSP